MTKTDVNLLMTLLTHCRQLQDFFKNTDSLDVLYEHEIDKFVPCLNSKLLIVLTSQ